MWMSVIIAYHLLPSDVYFPSAMEQCTPLNVPTCQYIPVVPARGGAEVALKIYMRPFSSIELACAVRQPSPCKYIWDLPPHNIAHATFMQPFQCDLPPQRQETHRTTHTGTTTRCKTHRRNRLNSKRSKPHPSHTRGTFHRRLQPLYTVKHKVSCSGFLPTT